MLYFRGLRRYICTRLKRINTLLAVCALAYCLVLTTPSHADDDDLKTNSATLTLTAHAQQLAGITTLTLTPTTRQAEFTAYGKVVNIQPLLELRNRYKLAVTDNRAALARYRQAQQDINRQQDLYRSGISSKRNLQAQQAQWQSAQAQVASADLQGTAIKDEARLLWGKTLTDWAFAAPAQELDALITGQRHLLQITLPANKQLDKPGVQIVADASGNRSLARPALWLSVATQTDAQGASHYFQSDDNRLIAGMKVTAWIPEQHQALTGVTLPTSAVLWLMGEAFVYIKTSTDSFARLAIADYFAVADGYFVSTGLKSGDQVVSLGAQTLLSEELRGQIPDLDDDD